jgi:hypothetical protein
LRIKEELPVPGDEAVDTLLHISERVSSNFGREVTALSVEKFKMEPSSYRV